MTVVSTADLLAILPELLVMTGGCLLLVLAPLLVIYLGLELMSLCLYVMAGFKRYELRPLEAAAKYFILGSFSSGILLYGISLLFGRTGSTTLVGIREGIASLPAGDPILMLAMSLLVVGFGFKVAAVPFHMWT